MSGPVCVCDYQFSDESQSEVTDRLKEMLDIDAAEEDIDTRQEAPAEIMEKDAVAGRKDVCLHSICHAVHDYRLYSEQILNSEFTGQKYWFSFLFLLSLDFLLTRI